MTDNPQYPIDLPEPLQEGEGSWEWGKCWLYCLREVAWVTWIGPVKSAGSDSVPMYACAECIEILHKKVWTELLSK